MWRSSSLLAAATSFSSVWMTTEEDEAGLSAELKQSKGHTVNFESARTVTTCPNEELLKEVKRRLAE